MTGTTRLVLMVSVATLLFGNACVVMSSEMPSVIPSPVEMTLQDGSFCLQPSTVVTCCKESKDTARQLVDALHPAMGGRLEIVESVANKQSCIDISLDQSLISQLGEEGYTLDVSPQRITLRAAAQPGLFYAVQTVRQLLPTTIFSMTKVNDVQWHVPCVRIVDYPRFAWRGLLIDPARHFIPVKDVKRFVDVMALHKFNRLQMHLTDDQGWRIEILKYPKLTKIGSRRDETLIGHVGSNPHRFDGKPHAGFYTQDDIRDMVDYAAARHVTIVPEIEMPGHFRAAISAYPWLGVFPEKQAGLKPWTRWGISQDVLAPRPRGVQFCKDVLSEVIDLFPSRHIHIGGDEAVRNHWEQSEEIQEMIRDKGLENEDELQSRFTGEMNQFLIDRGRILVGWDEILEGGLAPGAVVMSWRGEHGGITASQAGHDVIMAPTSHTYFDFYQGERASEPLAIGGFIPWEKVYRYEPIPESMSADQAAHVLGAQAQLWNEYIPTAKHREYMAWPRGSALAEVLWSPKEGRDEAEFRKRLGKQCERLDRVGVNYRPLD